MSNFHLPIEQQILQDILISPLQQYLRIRKQTEKIVAPLETEDYSSQPVVDVSPPKWHLGHSSWFFENFLLSKYIKGYQLYNPDFNYIFNSYYESQGERILRNKRGTLSRPSTKEIMSFRAHVDQQMSTLLENEELLDNEFFTFFSIGLNHEQQHQELLVTDIKYILGSNPLLPKYANFAELQGNPIKEEWLKINEGNYTIGYNGEGFHFDNEKGVHQVFLHDFECMNRLVTNEEYMAFIADGGYHKAELWLAEGWDWVQKNKAEFPFYWLKKEQKYFSYQLNGLLEIDKNKAVTHVNFYEADAYARWKSCRLLTEFEWEVAANLHGETTTAHFQEKGSFQPGVAMDKQFHGTAWEWTNSAYLPYPYYRQEEGALGEYNGKFMINQMVLRGGSCATPKDHYRPTYRNFFHPHLQWQFTGIRLAKTIHH